MKERVNQWAMAIVLWFMIRTTDRLAQSATKPARARRYYNNMGDILSRSCGKWLYSAQGGATKGQSVPEQFRISHRQAMKEMAVHSFGFWFNLSPYDHQEPIVTEVKVGRNDPCPCGSNKKHKVCCGRKAA